MDIRSGTLQSAVGAIVDDSATRWAGRDEALVIADHLVVEGALDVLLVAPEPQACRAAVVAMRSRRVRAVLVAPDELDILVRVIACLDDAVHVIGSVVVELAEKLPALSDRDLELLSVLASGSTIVSLADRFDTSMSSMKRDIARLCAVTGARSRRELQQFGQGLLLAGWHLESDANSGPARSAAAVQI